MKFKMIDGTIYTGRSYDDIVANMSEDKLTTVRSVDTYRRATARRVSEQYGLIIDATTNREFIRSLVQAELMTKVS